jgi:hypothetical protein
VTATTTDERVASMPDVGDSEGERFEIRELPSGRVLATATTLAGARLAVRTITAECGSLRLSIYDRRRRGSAARSARDSGR